MKTLKLIDNALAKIEGWLIVIFLSLVISFTFFQIVLRSFYTHAQAEWSNAILGRVDWADPLVRLLVLWITFLGASLLTRDNKHIKIDLMSAIFPPRWLPFRELVLSTSCVLISGLMLKSSIDYVRMEMAFGDHLFLNFPTWVGQLILPVGFSLILFRFFLTALEQVFEILRGVKT
jgi:TRAP-type C4-dicarboxylate transport system permease small subunit